MAERFLIFKSAEDLRKGDLFVSCFSMKGSDYPVAKTVKDIVDSGEYVTLFFEGGDYEKIMKGMKIITQDKTPMKEGK